MEASTDPNLAQSSRRRVESTDASRSSDGLWQLTPDRATTLVRRSVHGLREARTIPRRVVFAILFSRAHRCHPPSRNRLSVRSRPVESSAGFSPFPLKRYECRLTFQSCDAGPSSRLDGHLYSIPPGPLPTAHTLCAGVPRSRAVRGVGAARPLRGVANRLRYRVPTNASRFDMAEGSDQGVGDRNSRTPAPGWKPALSTTSLLDRTSRIQPRSSSVSS